jgi:hypothetical protein
MTAEAGQQQGTPAPIPGTPEYDAAMAAKYDNRLAGGHPNADDTLAKELTGGTGKQPDNKPVKPEGVPDKFWNADKGEVNYAAWAQSTAELESRFTKQQQQQKQDDTTKAHADKKAALQSAVDALKADPNHKPEDLQAAEKALKDHGDAPAAPAPSTDKLDFNAFTEEYASTGELSADSYAKLEKSGLPKDVVDTYIDGIKARAELIAQSTYKLVGGEENYTKMLDWAKANLSATEKQAFNQTQGAAREMAVQGLYQRFSTANGSEPNLVQGGNTGPASSGYKSVAEMKAAMRDPRYWTDPAYQAEVEKKIESGMKAGYL